ncbi:hypothetical protein KDL45_18565, partial [bacterium]|nr:hypothetical protein [bacterium]
LQLSRQLGLDQVHVISGGGQDVPVPIPIPKAGDAKARDGAGTDGSNAGGKDDSAPGDGSQPEVRDGDR